MDQPCKDIAGAIDVSCDAVDGDEVFTGARVTDIVMGCEAVDRDAVFASA